MCGYILCSPSHEPTLLTHDRLRMRPVTHNIIVVPWKYPDPRVTNFFTSPPRRFPKHLFADI
jgi:hypothetical protein